jgi:hypothetical protein
MAQQASGSRGLQSFVDRLVNRQEQQNTAGCYEIGVEAYFYIHPLVTIHGAWGPTIEATNLPGFGPIDKFIHSCAYPIAALKQ